MKKRLRYIPFILLGLLVMVLAAATFIEARFGTPFVEKHIYGSWWFVVLWALTALWSLLLSIRSKMYKKFPIFLLHAACMVILAGALLTFLTAERGSLHLRTDGTATAKDIQIPFDVKLLQFDVVYYAGTRSASDFVSRILLTDGGKTDSAVVSMNNVYTHGGYRFYQSSYDNDLQGSLLRVSFDPYGTTVTYAGYVLLFLSLVWIPFYGKSAFRKAVRKMKKENSSQFDKSTGISAATLP
jgi:hypothetical protein